MPACRCISFCVFASALPSFTFAQEGRRVSTNYLAGPECGIAVSNGVTSLTEASLHIYHGVLDCAVAQNVSLSELTRRPAGFRCTSDIMETIAAVADTAAYVVNVFGGCFDQHVKLPKCVNSGLKLASNVASLASASALLDITCLDALHPISKRKFHGAHCVIDIKKALDNALETVGFATSIKAACDHSAAACASGIFGGVGSIAGVAEFTLASFSDCSSTIPMHAECGSAIAKLIRSLAKIASIAMHVRKDCGNYSYYTNPTTGTSSALHGFETGWDTATDKKKTKDDLATLLEAMVNPSRLYNQQKDVERGSPLSSATVNSVLMFGAIPLALILGFLGGRRARHLPTSPTRDLLAVAREDDFD